VFNQSEIIAKSWLTAEVVNLVLLPEQRSVDRIFLIGSYASGKENHRSDLDFLIQLKGGRSGQYYVTWKQAEEIQKQVGPRIHVVFGTYEAAERLHQKHKNEDKNYAYKEITQGRLHNAYTYRPLLSQ
jgi:predicted nucleotidyltransferase